MRLFTAITLDDGLEDQLFQIITQLRNNTTGGTFTLKDNLHLTLNFIGETTRLEAVKQAMKQAVEKAKPEKTLLNFGGLGRFKRREGDIYWIGVENNAVISGLQKQILKELQEAGFYDIDDREFKPHLTLARKISAKGDTLIKKIEGNIIPMSMMVSKISLMKSERVDGKLVYTEIYQVPFE